MSFPDYYNILEIPETATQEEIRQAYKKQALLHHPDRLPPSASKKEREEATKRFQQIADALYVLGNEQRRKDYDTSRNRQGFSNTSDPHTTASQAHHVFGNVFEDLLKPEVDRPGHTWRILGAGAGAVLGFIVGNVGGAAVGALAGKTLGQIRDHKGVSVYTAFQRLELDQRRDILTTLLTRFLMSGSAGVM
ncbi:DnaJ-domain-containing protein, partial [Halteromyces radiatus]|uniref:DnaJ-domain-containing protein n=1 Tax=Halteromyces radiatus TaxID=101107 RepID=UPI00221FB900